MVVGLIQLSVNVTRTHVPILFHIVNDTSSYNDILGRTWLDKVGVVSSLMHRCLKFYNRRGRYIIVHANEVDSCDCSVQTAKLARGINLSKTLDKRKKPTSDGEKEESLNGEMTAKKIKESEVPELATPSSE